jgi:hypothetical protein
VAKLRLTIDVPTPGSTTVSNYLCLAGVVGLAVSAGGLVGNWWVSALVGSLVLIVVAAVAKYNARGDGDTGEPGPAASQNVERRRPPFGVVDDELPRGA